MSSILGISAFYHDSAACLLINGEIVAAVQEERFSRKKHDPRYPYHAVEFVLNNSNMKLSEIEKENSQSKYKYMKEMSGSREKNGKLTKRKKKHKQRKENSE